MKIELVGLSLAMSIGLSVPTWAELPVLRSVSDVPPTKASAESALPPEALGEASEPIEMLALASGAPRGRRHGAGQSAVRRASHGVQPSSAALRQGIALYQRGYIAKAIPLLEKATRQTPQDDTAFLWLARACQKQGGSGYLAKAKDAYRQALTINPNQVEALSSLGEILSWDPTTRAQAIELLSHAYELKPSDPLISRHLAEAYFWNGNAIDALRYAAPVADRFQNDAKWMRDYAQILTVTGHADEALGIYNGVLKGQAGNGIQLKLDRARALLKSGRAEEASSLYADIASEAGRQSANPSGLLSELSSLAFDLGIYEDALKWDQALPEPTRSDRETRLRDARALIKSFRSPEAIEQFQRLYEAGQLSVSEKLEYAAYLRALQLPPEALPKPDLVEALYRDAAAEAPDNPEVSLNLARLHSERAHFDDAVQAYRRTLENPALVNRDGVKKEFLEYLKSEKSRAADAEALITQMLAAAPDDVLVKAAYAEFLSWRAERRAEALRLYTDLGKADPANAPVWEGRIEEVLKWHQPTTALIPLYQEIVNLYPKNKTVWLSIARAYRGDKNYYKEAVETYGTLVTRYPDDGVVKKEWLNLLMSNASRRGENIRLLKKMTADNPSDPDLMATYGKLLSYDHRYEPAMEAFNAVLSKKPEHREALIGKGYLVLWSGRKFAAKAFFEDLRKKYPDDVDIAIGLAQTDKLIGRYDEALKILQEIKPLMDAQVNAQQDLHIVPTSAPSEGEIGPPAPVPPQSAQPDGEQASPAQPSEGQSQPAPSAGEQSPSGSSAEPPLPLKGENTSLTPQAVSLGDDKIPSLRLGWAESPSADFLLVAYHEAPSDNPYGLTPISDVSVEPVAIAAAPQAMAQPDAGSSESMQALQSDVEALSDAVNALKAVQQSARTQLDGLDRSIRTVKDAVPYQMTLQPQYPDSGHSRLAGLSGGSGGFMASGESVGGTGENVGEGGMRPVYGTYAALDYDTNPLLSGLGRFRNDELPQLEKGLIHDLRPMFRAGFLYSRQGGDATTTRLSGWGFPNQVSMSLTPQVRLRGGIRPTRYFLPDGVSPDKTWGIEYGLGATVKYWDRLTLDGDIALTHFTQSSSENLTFQTQAKYDFNDSISAKIGVSRLPQSTSLLTLTGLRPSVGAFANSLVGQARENSIYGELNTHPFSQNWDWNLGYAWAFVDGSHTPRNFKNQAFTSLGYTWHYLANHQARLGYEFLYFGYGKNATNGFFDTTANGATRPVVNLDPVTLANRAYVFGGYYSPSLFLMNAARVDFRGSLFNQFLEYKLGGSLGMQTVQMGHGLKGSGNGTSLSSAFDANVIMNVTDWLAAYGDVDFLDAAGQFNRWRFGGGLILRPRINALSPVFGPKAGK